MTQTYSGPLSDYSYSSVEFGDLLSFLKQVQRPNKVFLIDSVDLNPSLPSRDFDTYIIGCFGEYANVNFLQQMDKLYADKKLICITSQEIDFQLLPNFRVYNIEHLHKLQTYFIKNTFKQLKERTYLHSILTRRVDVHRYLFTAALLSRSGNVTYSLVKVAEDKKISLVEFEQLLREYLNYQINEPKVREILADLLMADAKILPGGQWSLYNDAYTNTKLHWVNESVFLSIAGEPRAYITEKTIKPIVSCTPFIILGQSKTYARLKKLHINTYDEIFEIKHDDIEAEPNRIEKIFKLMESCTCEFINDNLVELQKIADYNYDYFYHGISKHCEELNSFAYNQIVDYIND